MRIEVFIRHSSNRRMTQLYQAIFSPRTVAPTRGEAKDLVLKNQGRLIHFILDAWREAVKHLAYPGLLLHDCRRTALRNFVRAGASDKVTRAISDPKTRSVFDRFTIVDEREFRDATVKMERHLSKRLGPIWLIKDQFQGIRRREIR